MSLPAVNMRPYLMYYQVILLAVFFSCSSIKTYPDATGPRFSHDFRDSTPVFNDTIKVVSFNIANAAEIRQAITELSNSSQLAPADVILLQEMDEAGTGEIARALKTAFVYYPSTNKKGKNFGNAILSRWPLSNDHKQILPYDYPVQKSLRAAVSAEIAVGDLTLLAVSVHTHTILLSEEKRLAQVDSLLSKISPDWKYVIVGGDFNSPGIPNVEAIENIFGRHGYQRGTENVGPTLKLGPLAFTLDHIFCKGFEVVSAGKLESSLASDHLPVWVKLIFQNPE